MPFPLEDCSVFGNFVITLITRQLSGRPPITNSPVKDSNGNVISKNEEQLKRWKEHFQEVLNRPPPIITPAIEEGPTLDINIENISRDKNGKSGGVDNIPPKVILKQWICCPSPLN